jgi:DNA-nicking Smr family endonuclease
MKKNDTPENEQDLFRQAMRGVKPLTTTKIEPLYAPPLLFKKSSKNQQSEDSFGPSTFSNYETLDPVSSEEALEFHRSGIQHKILRKLRTGQYNVEAILDLHGMITEEASEALHCFLLRCHAKGIRHVLIIHGKGRNSNKPILKNKLNHWLRQTEQVLAFCSATVKDGRSGSMYVLLKQGR